MFHALAETGRGIPYAPVGISILERDFDEPETRSYLWELRTRLVPAMRRRIVRDRLSPALPRWVEVPGFDPSDNLLAVPKPGDGSLRAILDWTAHWATRPFAPDRPPWRGVYFRDVEVDGEGGRVVTVSQVHHAIIDGEGSRRLAAQYVQLDPDAQLPPMPALPPLDTSTAWERWKEGWALEGAKARQVLRNGKARLAWAAVNPTAAARRARELAAAVRRMAASQGTAGHSSLLRRRSDGVRFDWLTYPVEDLKAGPRTMGGTLNDGFLAAMSMALHAYHRDHGTEVAGLRTAVAVSTRTADQGHQGNRVIAVVVELPVCEDPAEAVKACAAVVRGHLEDHDVLWLLDRFRAIANRLPQRLLGRITERQMRGFDLQLSNSAGLPARSYVAGVETIGQCGLAVTGPSALTIILSSNGGIASLGISTDPVAITDPEHLVARIDEAFRAVIGLAG